MSVNIKNREVEALLAEIKGATGKGTSRIVLELLRDEVRCFRRAGGVDVRRREIEETTRRYSTRLPARLPPADAIIEYDEWGLPE